MTHPCTLGFPGYLTENHIFLKLLSMELWWSNYLALRFISFFLPNSSIFSSQHQAIFFQYLFVSYVLWVSVAPSSCSQTIFVSQLGFWSPSIRRMLLCRVFSTLRVQRCTRNDIFWIFFLFPQILHNICI